VKVSQLIEEFKQKARERGIPFRNFEVETYGKGTTIHVRSRHVSAEPLQWCAQQLVAQYGGQRYATLRSGGPFTSYSFFSFKIKGAR